MADYTIRYLRSDGAVTMFYRPSCFSDADASRQAASQMRPEFAMAEIWRDLDCVTVLTSVQRSADAESLALPPAA